MENYKTLNQPEITSMDMLRVLAPWGFFLVCVGVVAYPVFGIVTATVQIIGQVIG
jgi:hypothetical protein